MASGYAWFLVLGSVFLCNLMKTLLPTISSFVSRGYLLEKKRYFDCVHAEAVGVIPVASSYTQQTIVS